MKLYSIRDWDSIFENNRSREIKNVNWVPMPNRLDGENFSAIMQHENGAEIFTAWILIVEVASRCGVRGTLLRGDGKPHSPATLSLKTRAPQKWFEIALEFLENNTDWLIVKDVKINPAPSCGKVPSIPHLTAIEQNRTEQNRKNGTEGKERSVKNGSLHSEFIKLWVHWYEKKFTGSTYSVQGAKDGDAVKRLLATGKTPKQLIRIAWFIWCAPKSKVDKFYAGQAMTIAGFASKINEFTVWAAELDRPDQVLTPTEKGRPGEQNL